MDIFTTMFSITTTNTEETFIQDFQDILKRKLKISRKS